MTNEQSIELAEANDLWRQVVGNYAWAVRIGVDRILRVEFGEPHLTVREPIASTSENTRVSDILARRQVIPTGEWSLFVENGLWRITTNGLRCHRSDLDQSTAGSCLENLSGQRVNRVVISEKSPTLTIDFDLAGAITIDLEPDVLKDSQWMLFFRSGEVLSFENDGKFVLERSDRDA